MTIIQDAKGSCLCGVVKIDVKKMSPSVGACHCQMCRKWSGGPLLAVDCSNDVVFAGADNISVFDSSEWAERGFCSKCGSHLYYKLKQNSQYIMPVGLFEDNEKFDFDHQVFIEERPPYYCFANKTKEMTGEELFAAFAEENE